MALSLRDSLQSAHFFEGQVGWVGRYPGKHPPNPLLILGVLGSCVGTLLYFSLIHAIGPTRTVLTTYFFPLVGVILGVLFLNETPTWNMLVGGAMILSGIGLVNYQWRKNSDERSAVNV